jgi:hypothetical protein
VPPAHSAMFRAQRQTARNGVHVAHRTVMYPHAPMARRSLKPHLNQIRTWVRQGRTDAWIAHQLEVTVQQIDAFKRENELAPADDNGSDAVAVDFDDEIDLRAEDDALIAAELEAAEARRAEEEAARAAAEEEAARAAAERGDDEEEDEDEDAEGAPKRRRGRRGGRGRARRAVSPSTFEGTFDHGEEGYGLWLDPAVSDSPIYAEHWAGHRPVEVTVEEDQIVIRRAGGEDD